MSDAEWFRTVAPYLLLQQERLAFGKIRRVTEEIRLPPPPPPPPPVYPGVDATDKIPVKF
jgi:hypothetical protein